MLHFAILFSFCISHLFPHQRRCSNLANSPHNGFHWSTICRVLHTLSSFVPLFFISKSLTRKRDNLDECSTTPPFEHSCAVNKYINATNDSMDHGLRLRFVPDGFCWFWRLVIRNNSNVGSHMGQFLQGGKNGRLMSFFFKVEPPCDQTWWDSLVFSILSCFSYVVDAENTLVGPVGPF